MHAFLSFWLFWTAATPIVTPSAGLDELVEEIGSAVVIGDIRALAAYRSRLRDELQTHAGSDSGPLRYTLAYVSWRLAFLPGHEEMFDRHVLLEESEHELKKLVERDPRDAEAYALLGAVYGAQITSNWKKLTIGRQAERVLKRAAELEPDNPRVVLNRAVATFYKPRILGGGKDKALRGLERAEGLFDNETPDKSWPNWGRIELETWRGYMLAQKGEFDGARAAYRRALWMAPGHSRVLNLLLPALEEQEKKGAGTK